MDHYTSSVTLPDRLEVDLGQELIGPLGGDYTPAGEYHVIPALNHPRWTEPTIHHSMRHHSRGNWQVAVAHDGERVIEATSHQPRAPQPPMLIHRRGHGERFTLRLRLRPLAGLDELRGVVVGYRHCRDCFELQFAAGRIALRRRLHTQLETLAAADCPLAADRWNDLVVHADDQGLRVELDGATALTAAVAIPNGRWGLIANHVTRFAGLVVEGVCEAPADPLDGPRPELWRRIDFRGWGSDRNLRWGDVDGDGRPELLVATALDRLGGDNACNLASLALFDLDGGLRWTRGSPAHTAHHTTCDLCVQLHDLDGIGRCHAVYCWDDRLVVADGASGEVVRSRRLPPTDEGDWPVLVGDSIAFADLLGHGRRDCLLVKDRYRRLHAFDRNLDLLWSRSGNTGHFPHPIDLDGDGRDEVLVGYRCLASDGTIRWDLEDRIGDHADNIAAAPIGTGGAWRIVICASDAGLFVLDAAGTILAHHAIGHAQSSCIARLLEGRDDHQILVDTFWGAAGITICLDGEGRRIGEEFEPMPYACLQQPVNWVPLGVDGIPRDLVLLSTHPHFGGLIDGTGRRRVAFPDDGHPVLCSDARDLDGDGVDEVLSWDHDQLWIYRAAVAGRDPATYPRRSPWYNDSNYRTQISL